MKILTSFSIVVMALFLTNCGTNKNTSSPIKNSVKMELSNKEKAIALIESLESGTQAPIGYINPEKYTQHNLAVGDGLAGFGAVVANAPEGGFKAKVIRAFEDGDYVFLHVDYDFFGPKAGFDVFKFEDGRIVEHWDNLSEITPPNPSGRTQLDGTTTISDKEKTAINKTLIKNFVVDVLKDGKAEKITNYVSTEKYLQHNSAIGDGLDGLGAALQYFAENGLVLEYDKVHKVLGEGNFVLTISEGKFGQGDHVAYFDLFRLEAGKIVEHWDIIQNIPAKSEWANQNGKFGF